jgi:hypothetical protein
MDEKIMTEQSPHHRLVTEAFERWLPRRCEAAWMRRMTGPARFDWDYRALQVGFFDLVYRYFDALPRRVAPRFAALLVEALERPPRELSAAYAALELAYLSRPMVARMRNRPTVADAEPEAPVAPLPVLVTAAYNLRQLSASIIASHEAGLAPLVRTWVAYRFSCALTQRGVSGAMAIQGSQAGFYETPARWQRGIHLGVTSHTWLLAVDIALASAEQRDATWAEELRRCVHELAVADVIAVGLVDCLGSREPHDLPIQFGVPVSGPSLRGFLEHARRAFDAGSSARDGVLPAAVSGCLSEFALRDVMPVLAQAEEIVNAL